VQPGTDTDDKVQTAPPKSQRCAGGALSFGMVRHQLENLVSAWNRTDLSAVCASRPHSAPTRGLVLQDPPRAGFSLSGRARWDGSGWRTRVGSRLVGLIAAARTTTSCSIWDAPSGWEGHVHPSEFVVCNLVEDILRLRGNGARDVVEGLADTAAAIANTDPALRTHLARYMLEMIFELDSHVLLVGRACQ